MSRFVSKAGADFDSLHHQLLRRAPVDGEEEESSGHSEGDSGDLDVDASQTGGDNTGNDKIPTKGHRLSQSLARRRRREVSDDGIGPSMSSPASTPVSLSGTSSPIAQERPHRPHAHHTNSNASARKPRRQLSDDEDPVQPYNAQDASSKADSGASTPHSGGTNRRVKSKQAKGVSFEVKSADDDEIVSDGQQVQSLPQDPLVDAVEDESSARTKRATVKSQDGPPRKLGTWDGVFMPVTLNMLGIILFLRFGFILGQAGLLGSILLLILSYLIDAATSMSVSAISTNGQVRGGGAYYLISRCLGPEFGGSIGIIFFAGQILNTAMNVLGFVESLTDAFGESRGPRGFLPEGPWFNFFYGSVVLLISTVVCLVGASLFARATLGLAVVLGFAIISIPVSSIAVKPFVNLERGAYYTGWAFNTFRGNLLPHFTSGAAGSSTGSEKENWSSVFGVLFPAVTGVLAGASMSGDLRKPSKSIPKGTNWALVFTFGVYFLSFVVFACTIERQSFYEDVAIVSDVALSPTLVTFGALASTGFSALMGVMACGKVLQAIARDSLLPALDIFGQGTDRDDTPTYAVLVTYLFCQAVLFVDSVNTIAQLVTMTTLLTFGSLSFATLALKAGGAPSFRPSFRYWNIWTAGSGAVACFAAMVFSGPIAAMGCVVVAIFLFAAVHVFSPPKPWGDVTRNLTYHMVRKFLLRLDERKGHVKYWRPQILLLANNASDDWNLIIFCNALKKGALYILGHILKGEFAECLPELRLQQIAWLKLVDISGIKSFVDVVIARDEREGARNLVLSCGLGGMRPNIVAMGFPSQLLERAARRASEKALLELPSGGTSIAPSRVASPKPRLYGRDESEITIRAAAQSLANGLSHRSVDIKSLPTDRARRETPIEPTTYVGIMEDTLALNRALAIAYGFENLQAPMHPHTKHSASKLFSSFRWASAAPPSSHESATQQYIDLWPIQISSSDLSSDPSHAWDTYTMVLQLGTILSFTGAWKSHKLRVSVFVEHEYEIEDERKRVRSLLDNLRIPASLRVFHLASTTNASYQAIVFGRKAVPARVEETMQGDPWWEALKQLRKEEERRAKLEAEATAARLRADKSATPQQIGAGGEVGRKQTKREKKLLGVSLPAEHLEFHRNNIRLGLSHPRARPDNEHDSDLEDENWDSDSDLSDELASLGEDDWEFGISAGSGLRRSKTFTSALLPSVRSRRTRSFSLGGSSGLPDEPGKRPLLTPDSDTPYATSYGSIASSTSTHLQSVSLASNSSGGTLRAVPRKGSLLKQDGGGTTLTLPDSFSRPSSRLSSRRSSVSTSTPTTDHLVPTTLDDESDRESTLRASDRVEYAAKAKEQAWRASVADEEDDHTSAPPTLHSSRTSVRLSFNELPNRAQYLILNELIRINSSPLTSVVITALPAPEQGTADSEKASVRYLSQLRSLFEGGPPMLGVHARTLTVREKQGGQKSERLMAHRCELSQMTMSL